MTNYYVYTHNNIKTGKCFYVGIGKNDRVFDGGGKRNQKWKRYVWDNNGFQFQIIVNGITKEKALEIERNCILKLGLENLCNIVGEEGNSTAFKKGLIPWNKGLKNAQAPSSKKVIYNGDLFDSVNKLIEHLQIGTTTFYRRLKKGQIQIEYVSSNYCN
jgi:hypothetical protein